MSKGRKGKRVMAAAMAVVLSVATVTAGVLPNTAVMCMQKNRIERGPN